MAEALKTEPMPLVRGADGIIRVRGTRVTLDSLVAAFTEGASAEEIAEQYPSVALADVYHVIGYYLRHSGELVSYFEERQHTSEEVRRSNELSSPPDGIRDRLLARRSR